MFFTKKKYGEKLLKCPRCRIYMKKIKKEDVIIDVCEKCNGLWLDDHEIDKLNALAKRTSVKAKSKKISKTKSKVKSK